MAPRSDQRREFRSDGTPARAEFRSDETLPAAVPQRLRGVAPPRPPSPSPRRPPRPGAPSPTPCAGTSACRTSAADRSTPDGSPPRSEHRSSCRRPYAARPVRMLRGDDDQEHEPGRRRRVRHRHPPYVFEMTYTNEHQEHEGRRPRTSGTFALRSAEQPSNGFPTPMHHDPTARADKINTGTAHALPGRRTDWHA